ncbi:MAG: ABC-2 transporter permease [Oscillospiraceae bacterium]|nr:ABC-2 transporter permease [Oscillospiraceae bacterium]
MRALLRKDLYTAVISLRSVFLIMAVFSAVTIFVPNTGFYIPYLVVLPGTLASTLINLETREKWNVCALTLPVSRRTVVTERYVCTLLMVLCGALLGGVCLALRALRGFESADIFESLAMCLAAGLLVPSIIVPMAYKFGADKGRYLVMFVIIGVMIGLMTITGEDFRMSTVPVWLSPWTLLLLCGALFAASWGVSAAIYEKKEIG